MLRIGLTGGIGSGKSTASAVLADLGAVVIDADRIAREIVMPGQPILARIRDRFGSGVFAADGTLDRPALGRLVFGDPAALAALEQLTHPAIWARTAELFESAPADSIVVHDMPLLVEKSMSEQYHLVLAVMADVETRVRRLVELRAMSEPDARARIAAQADDDARLRAADILLGNDGPQAHLAAQIHQLWADRLVPFAANLLAGQIAPADSRLSLSPYHPGWTVQATRLGSRIRYALGQPALALAHVGSTAVPGMIAKDVIDLQLAVDSLAVADDPAFVDALAAAGFPRRWDIRADQSKDGTDWPKRFHSAADPGRAVNLHIRERHSPAWRWALLCRDWLRSSPHERQEYTRAKRRLLDSGLSRSAYADAKEPWFESANDRMEAWARRTGWRTPTA